MGNRSYVVILVLMAILLISPSSGVSTPSTVGGAVPVAYGYVTKSELVVMRADRVVGRAPIQFDFALGDVIVTVDGRYFAVLSGTKGSVGFNNTQLVTIDATTGSVRNLDCEMCESIAPIGGSRVLASLVEKGFLRFNLATARLPAKFDPEVESYRPQLRLLSGADGLALASGHDATRENYQAFYFVRPDGDARQVHSIPRYKISTAGLSYVYAQGRSVGLKLPDGELRFAASSVYRRADVKCADDGSVLIFSSTRDPEVDTNFSDANRASIVPGVDGTLFTYDMWWDTSGDLHAVVLNSGCGEGDTYLNEWLFRDGHWLQVSSEPVRAVRQLDEATRIVLRPNESLSSGAGDLYLDIRGQDEKKIAADVIFITATSAIGTPLADRCQIDPQSCAPKPTMDQFLNAPVPSMCNHPPGNLVDGSLPDIPENEGFVSLAAKQNPESTGATLAAGDLTGDGQDDFAVVFDCSEGGVSWPEHIVLYGPGPQILGAVDLGTLSTAIHADVTQLSIVDGHVEFKWTTSDGVVGCPEQRSAQLVWSGNDVEVRDVASVPASSGC